MTIADSTNIYAPGIGELDRELWWAKLTEAKRVGTDMEGTAFTIQDYWDEGWRPRSWQFGLKGEGIFLRLDDPEQLQFTKDVLSNPDIQFFLYTDTEVLAAARAFGIDILPRTVDVYIMSRLNDHRTKAEGVAHGLKEVTARFLDDGLQGEQGELYDEFLRIWQKADRGRATKEALQEFGWNTIPVDNPVYVKYGVLDAVYTLHLADLFTESPNIDSELLNTELWLADQATVWRAQGIKIDREYTQKLHDDTVEARKEPASKFLEMTEFKINSPLKYKWFENQGVEFKFFNKKKDGSQGNPQMDKKFGVPDLVARYSEDPVVKPALDLIVKYAEDGNTATNTRIFLGHADSNDYVHPRVQTLEAHTGRMSIVKPALQTLPKTDVRQRGCFIAAEGNVFVGADFEQVELRLAAALSGEEKLLDAIRKGQDLHQATADLMFGEGASKEQRAVAKTINFSILYGAGVTRVMTACKLTEEKAREALALWRKSFPKLNAYLRRLSDMEGSRVLTLAGRSIPVDPERSYANPNYYIQSLGRDLLAYGLYRFVEVKGWYSAVKFPIHDEALVEVPVEDARQAASDLTWAMSFQFMGVPIAAQGEVIGPRWKPLG